MSETLGDEVALAILIPEIPIEPPQQINETPQNFNCLRSIAKAAVVGALAVTATLLPNIEPTPARAANAVQAVIGIPFNSKWAADRLVNPPYSDANSSHPSVHPSYGFDFATDIYPTSSINKEVRVYGRSPSGVVTFKRAGTSDTCETSGPNIAGKGVTFDVYVGQNKVGQAKYDHLDLVDVGNDPIASGTKIGDITSEPFHPVCYQVAHAHVQLKNTEGAFACYADHGNPGQTLNAGDNLGVLGSMNEGTKQACTEIPTGDTPPANSPIAKKPKVDINGDGNDDLLLMSHDPDGAAGANVGLSTNTGFWFQPEWWRDRYTDFAPMKPFVGDVTGDGKADLTYLIPTAQGSQAWVVPTSGNGFYPPRLWWNGAGYQFDGIKAAMGDIDNNGTKDLILFTRQSAAGGIAISAALSTGAGFWLQPPWHADSFTDWNRMQVFAPDVNGDGAADPTLLVATPEGTDAWVQLSNKTSLGGPQRWWNGVGYQFDGIKAVVGDVDANGGDDLLLVTNQGPGQGTAVSPLRSTYNGFWLQPPWWTDRYTDWNYMTPVAGNFTGRRVNNRPIADFGFVAPSPNGVKTWVLPSTGSGLQGPQTWAELQGWGYSGVKVAQS